MTAPHPGPEPITVKVALGERSYDIVIGRALLASLGERIAALRPGARVGDRHRRDRRAPFTSPAAQAALAAASAPPGP